MKFKVGDRVQVKDDMWGVRTGVIINELRPAGWSVRMDGMECDMVLYFSSWELEDPFRAMIAEALSK